MSTRRWILLFRTPSLRICHSSSTLPPPISKWQSQSYIPRRLAYGLAGFLGGSALMYSMLSPNIKKKRIQSMVDWKSAGEEQDTKDLTIREKKFIEFSSVEYSGQLFMTPQDFLESITQEKPRTGLVNRRKLGMKDVLSMQENTPDISDNSDGLFRNLGSEGIISFSEYLFLLTILTKPKSGFKIAFSMLDQNGDEMIDKQEFKFLETVFSKAAQERNESENRKDHGLQMSHKVDTSLLIHFFGVNGDEKLKFTDFSKFMDNLQTEVLRVEFTEFSKGASSISELDFARILLRYTFLSSKDYTDTLDRLDERLQEKQKKGISFEEFEDFCKFLINLDDFQIAMRMYTLANKSISQEEFSRAVNICTGKNPSQHVVFTIFQIFDEDGDGLLSYQEFVAMMKDRIHRGVKNYSCCRQKGWEGFKHCLKKEMQVNPHFVND